MFPLKIISIQLFQLPQRAIQPVFHPGESEWHAPVLATRNYLGLHKALPVEPKVIQENSVYRLPVLYSQRLGCSQE